ncbi:hypothetical protein Zmor_021843 [Zophobas morio]|uniref:Uncharacterized protein n=1 Tax=Zophobas morio TaxID=2755281 RepID=A0AA38MAU4_9CUCU|nr:hypothetical protein Zmor_021843 [Zophobas morio]
MDLMIVFEIAITDGKSLLRNKPIRRPDTTPMGFLEALLVCTAMRGDSSLVTAAGRRSHKDKPGAGCRKSRLRGPEKPRSGIREPSRGMCGFKLLSFTHADFNC